MGAFKRDHEQLAVLWFGLENYTVRSQNENANEKNGRENSMWQEYSGRLSSFTAQCFEADQE